MLGRQMKTQVVTCQLTWDGWSAPPPHPSQATHLAKLLPSPNLPGFVTSVEKQPSPTHPMPTWKTFFNTSSEITTSMMSISSSQRQLAVLRAKTYSTPLKPGDQIPALPPANCVCLGNSLELSVSAPLSVLLRQCTSFTQRLWGPSAFTRDQVGSAWGLQ